MKTKHIRRIIPFRAGFLPLGALLIVALLALVGSVALFADHTSVYTPVQEKVYSLGPEENADVSVSDTSLEASNISKTPTASATTTEDITPVISGATERPAEVETTHEEVPQHVIVPAPIVVQPMPPEVSPPPPSPSLPSLSDLNTAARPSIVNILCTNKAGGALRPASGSGVIIDPRGVILTNAHVAQYFLLKDYKVKDFVNCVVRTGSPARALYKAELLYISQHWVQENPNINQQNESPTGANDFALLRITGRIVGGDAPLPSFVALPFELDEADIVRGDGGVVLAYPAGFLEGISIQNDLFLTSAVVTIGQRYSLSNGSLDLLSIGGSVVAQQGSSGGAFVRQRSGKLTGIVTLSTLGGTTSDRDLRVLTLSHIDRAFRKETGIGIVDLLSISDPAALAHQFNEDIAPALTKIMTDALK